MNKLSILTSFICALILCGCMQTSIVVDLKKDGSGTMEVVEKLTSEGVAMMSKMPGQDGKPAIAKFTDISEEGIKQKADEFGVGFTLSSAKQIKVDGVAVGRRIIYAFKDINSVSIKSANKAPSAPGKKADISFKYTPGKLIAETSNDEAAAKQAMQMFKKMDSIPAQMKSTLGGASIKMSLMVEGKITKTNAYYELPSKDGIMLLDVDVAKLLDSKEALKKLTTVPTNKTAEFRKAMKGYDFFRLDNQEKIEIEFK
jgi:hypothetical protein